MVCQKRWPGGAGGQGATPRPDNKYTKYVEVLANYCDHSTACECLVTITKYSEDKHIMELLPWKAYLPSCFIINPLGTLWTNNYFAFYNLLIFNIPNTAHKTVIYL